MELSSGPKKGLEIVNFELIMLIKYKIFLGKGALPLATAIPGGPETIA